jgi:putative ubiquitin-RnfH superfamily antitoxin RatB of RatAB toxin-antitoxin module
VNEAPLQIEIVYAEPRRAIVKSFLLARGSSVADALRLAALDPDFAGVDLEHSTVGIFGRVTGPDQVLEAGDRVEIYRPLAVDPKVSRRQRAKQARR